MPRLLTVGGENYQDIIVSFKEEEINLSLIYSPITGGWFANVQYKDTIIKGFRLALGTTHIRSNNLPFDFAVGDNSGRGIDPFAENDFVNRRCSLYLLDDVDMEAIRGEAVEI